MQTYAAPTSPPPVAIKAAMTAARNQRRYRRFFSSSIRYASLPCARARWSSRLGSGPPVARIENARTSDMSAPKRQRGGTTRITSNASSGAVHEEADPFANEAFHSWRSASIGSIRAARRAG